jgi:undecaprenyl-diphosphatase
LLAKPVAAAVFLFINGLVLLLGERLSRRAKTTQRAESDAVLAAHNASPDAELAGGTTRQLTEIREAKAADTRIAKLPYIDALYIGSLQIAALFAGISRSGASIVGGLWRGLDHEDAARFGFLLATPVILAAGFLKLPSLAGSAGANIHGQVIVGVIVAGIAAYFSVRFLMRWFHTRTLTPFAIYCLAVGAASFIRFA